MSEPRITEPSVTQPSLDLTRRRRRVRQTLLAVVIAGGITAGAVGVAYADTTPPIPTPTNSIAGAAHPGGHHHAGHGPGREGKGHRPHIGGTVTEVNGADITVTDRDGFTRHITTNATTTYREGAQPSTAAAVHIGTMIGASGSVDADHTTLDATNITIRTAHQPGDAPRDKRAPAPSGAEKAPPAPSTGDPSAPSTQPGG